MASSLDNNIASGWSENDSKILAEKIMGKLMEFFPPVRAENVEPEPEPEPEKEPEGSILNDARFENSEPEKSLVDVFNDALCKTLLENPSDIEKLQNQLTTIIKNVKNMKKSIKQMIARNSQHEDSVHVSVEHEEVEDVPASKFTENEVVVLKKVAAKDKRNSDGFYRRTIMLRNFRNRDHGEADSHYQRCLNMLQNWDLGFLLDRAENYFVSDKIIKLTFPTRRRAIINLLAAKNHVQNLSGCPVNIECLVPPSEVSKKWNLLQEMRQLKQQRFCTSYSVFEAKSSGTWVMKVRFFKRGLGTFVFNNANEAKNYVLGHLGHVNQTATEE